MGGEQNEPEIELGCTVNVSARYLHIKARFVDCPGDRADDEDCEQNHRQLERRKKFEDRIALPCSPRNESVRLADWLLG
jgi:hypothetical protein